MSLKPPKKSDLDKSWMKARRDKPKKIQPEYHLIITEGTDTEPAYFGAIYLKTKPARTHIIPAGFSYALYNHSLFPKSKLIHPAPDFSFPHPFTAPLPFFTSTIVNTPTPVNFPVFAVSVPDIQIRNTNLHYKWTVCIAHSVCIPRHCFRIHLLSIPVINFIARMLVSHRLRIIKYGIRAKL